MIEPHSNLDAKPSDVAESSGRLLASKTSGLELGMMNLRVTNSLKTLEAEVSAWPNVSIHSHRFGGREFRFGNAEVGHVHTGGIVDIPFPRSVRDLLLAEGLAEEHRWVPNSGWITFQIGSESEEGLNHALWLMRISYLRYALKTAPDPQKLLEQESDRLHLSPKLKSLLEPFAPGTANHVYGEADIRRAGGVELP